MLILQLEVNLKEHKAIRKYLKGGKKKQKKSKGSKKLVES